MYLCIDIYSDHKTGSYLIDTMQIDPDELETSFKGNPVRIKIKKKKIKKEKTLISSSCKHCQTWINRTLY